MKIIWKIELANDINCVYLPEGATVLTVGQQGGRGALWVEIDSNAPRKLRTFIVKGTGNQIDDPDNDPVGDYLGTFFLNNGANERHVFDSPSFEYSP